MTRYNVILPTMIQKRGKGVDAPDERRGLTVPIGQFEGGEHICCLLLKHPIIVLMLVHIIYEELNHAYFRRLIRSSQACIVSDGLVQRIACLPTGFQQPGIY